MKKLALVPLAALLVLAGCQDLRKEHVVPVEIAGPSFSVGGAGSERSSICLSYDERLAGYQADLAQDPGNEDLQGAVATFEAIIADNCEEE